MMQGSSMPRAASHSTATRRVSSSLTGCTWLRAEHAAETERQSPRLLLTLSTMSCRVCTVSAMLFAHAVAHLVLLVFKAEEEGASPAEQTPAEGAASEPAAESGEAAEQPPSERQQGASADDEAEDSGQRHPPVRRCASS